MYLTYTHLKSAEYRKDAQVGINSFKIQALFLEKLLFILCSVEHMNDIVIVIFL